MPPKNKSTRRLDRIISITAEKGGVLPRVIFGGRYLLNQGFDIGDYLHLTFEKDKMILKKVRL